MKNEKKLKFIYITRTVQLQEFEFYSIRIIEQAFQFIFIAIDERMMLTPDR